MTEGRPITPDEFGKLLKDFERSAFRLETLQTYNVPDETELIELFNSGAPQPKSHKTRPWTEQVRRLTATGRTMTRVHTVELPLTAYLQFEIQWGYTSNTDAGEQIFLRTDNQGFEKFEDFWLLDDRTVIQMRYAADGSWLGAELIDTPELVSPYRDAAQAALTDATPLKQFLTEID